MKIKTKFFGTIEIEEGTFLEFPWGVLGFPESKSFALLEMPDLPGFQFLQDLDNPYVSFTMIQPWEWFPDYEIQISDEELAGMGLEVHGKDALEVFVIVTVNDPMKDSTANLMAPVVIHSKNKIGKQFVLHDSSYGTRHRMFQETLGE